LRGALILRILSVGVHCDGESKGRQLVDVWGEMGQLQQFKLIQNLVQLESQLASMEFPGYGNLYFRHSTKDGSQVIPINDDYCIGPAYNASWFPQFGNQNYAGPCLSYLRLPYY
jgi:hypothetical protein